MSKNQVLEIRFESLDTFKRNVQRALSRKVEAIDSRHQVIFDSVESFRTFMTAQKVEILMVLARNRISSMYELAKRVDRDFAAVLRDCVALEGAGFIKLRSTKSARKSKAPSLSFNYSVIAIYLPTGEYQIEFPKAA